MDQQIQIGARYLREGIKRDYNDWRHAWAREVGQNSIDAGATRVDITVARNDDDTIVVWSDNGCGMTRDIVVNKFMALGESGKEGSDATGGFGVAGALIAFAQKSYSIRTDTIMARGSGSAYGIEEGLPYHKGVTLTVTMEGDEVSSIKNKIKRWVRFSSAKTKFYLNGVLLDGFKRRKAKAETPWCKVYTARNIPEYSAMIHVRMNGQLMFSMWSSFNHHVIVDLEGDSLSHLTANRDSLRWTYRSKLEKLTQEIYSNPNKIKPTDDFTTVWHGTEGLVRFDPDKPRKVSKIGFATDTVKRPTNKAVAKDLVAALKGCDTQLKPVFEAKTIEEIQDLIDGHDVVIVNQTNKEVPRKWLPGHMNAHAYKLLNRWIRVVQLAGSILGRNEEVSIGWVFSHEARALYKYSSKHGHMILINPVMVKDTRFTNYWDNSTSSFYELVAAAIHEICHIDNDCHNDAFARDLTYATAKVFSQATRLKKVKTQTKV